MKKLITHLELVLTGAGLVVVSAVLFFWKDRFGLPWMPAAITATAVGVLHGAIFWLVRRRQRYIRSLALKEAQRMLKDIVNNQLCLIQFSVDLPLQKPEELQRAHERISASVGRINATLNEMSEESLDLWKQKYSAADNTNGLDTA